MGPVYYTVQKINGDYAVLLSDDGVEKYRCYGSAPFWSR